MGAQMEIVRGGGGTCKLDVEKKRFGLERFLFGEARVRGHFIEIPVFPNGELNVDDTRIMIGHELTEKDPFMFLLFFSNWFQIGEFQKLVGDHFKIDVRFFFASLFFKQSITNLSLSPSY